MRSSHYLLLGLFVAGSTILLATAMAAEPEPKIRLVAVAPPSGTYPSHVVLSSDGSQVKLAVGGAVTKVWFKVEVSSWGTKGLSGYDAYLSYRCPSPPCDCFLRQETTACTNDSSCSEGAKCVSGRCESASIKDDSNYVFNGKTYHPSTFSSYSTTPPDANFSWNVRLATGQVAVPEPGTGTSPWRVAGTLMINFADFCAPGSTTSELKFDDKLTELIVGSAGARVKPFVRGVTVICE